MAKKIKSFSNDEMAELFHTGLRKALDSKWSSIIWNVIHILPKDVWADYVDFMAKAALKWNMEKITLENVTALFKWEGKATSRGERSLHLLLEAASPEDILCMHEWFKGCAGIMRSE